MSSLVPTGMKLLGAKRSRTHSYRYPENTIYDAKRLLGRKFMDRDLQSDMKYWSFIVKEDEGVPKIKINQKLLYPEQISAKLLAKLKSSAENFLKLDSGTIKKAVITVPAYFNDGQRQATVDAGELAGLEVLTILNEPTAAAIAYSLSVENKADAKPKELLVFDLGGGTFDVAVVKMHRQKVDVLGVNGDTYLGGEDFDKKIMEYCISQFKAETGLNLLEKKDSTNIKVREKVNQNLRRLQTYCENTKKCLTAGKTARVIVDAILDGKNLVVDITREQFEKMNANYFAKTIQLVDTTLKELKLSKTDIKDVVLVGGSTRIPKVQQLLSNYFEGKVLDLKNPDQDVAYGATIQAARIVEENSMGTPCQIRDVTSLSLGTKVEGNDFSVIIPKNTKIPTAMKRTYTTTEDNQTAMRIDIYQGEDFKVVTNNKLLGTYNLTGIPPNKARREKVEDTMRIDRMGIVHVTSVCISNGRTVRITVSENKNRMSKELKRKLLAEMK